MAAEVRSLEDIYSLARQVKERARRERLHREIGALKTKCDKVTTAQRFGWRERVWKMTAKIQRLEFELRQLELFL